MFTGDQLLADCLDQAPIARKPENVVYTIVFAPFHEIVPAEAGICAQQNPGPRPALPDLTGDPDNLLQCPCRRIDIGRPELRRQKVAATEDVERQIAVAVIIAVEEPTLLTAVQGIIGGVEVQNDLLC